MDYEAELKAIRAAANALHLNTRRLGWSIMRTVGSAVSRTVQGRIDAMRAESEPFRRLPSTEHARVWAEIEREETTARRLSAGVSLAAVAPHIQPLHTRLSAYVERRRRDVGLSFPTALDGFGPSDMLTFELLKETLRPTIDTLSAVDLSRRYTQGYESQSARGLAECDLIERRLERGGVARTDSDVAVFKALSAQVETVQFFRIEPADELERIGAIIGDASKAISRATTAQIAAVNPEHHAAAKAAHEQSEPEYREAEALAAAEAAAARAAGQ